MPEVEVREVPILLKDVRESETFAHLSDPDQNREEYARLMAQDSTEIGSTLGIDLPKDYELRIIEHLNEHIELEIFVANIKENRIALFNRIEKTEIHLEGIGDKPIKQAMIWRQSVGADAKATRDVVEEVFFKKLVGSYNIVVSDSEQTRDGKRMWMGLLYTAMNTVGLMAGVGSAKTGKVTEIRGEKDLRAQEKWLWGHLDFHKERLGVIATSKSP